MPDCITTRTQLQATGAAAATAVIIIHGIRTGLFMCVPLYEDRAISATATIAKEVTIIVVVVIIIFSAVKSN